MAGTTQVQAVEDVLKDRDQMKRMMDLHRTDGEFWGLDINHLDISSRHLNNSTFKLGLEKAMRKSLVFLIFLTPFVTYLLEFQADATPAGPLIKHLSSIIKWTRSSPKTPQKDGNVLQFENGYLVETVVEGNELGVVPYSIRVSQDGELFAVDAVNSNIVRITPPLSPYSRARLVAGSFQGYSGHVDGKPSDARFNHPKGVTMDGKGNVYVADTSNLAIRKIGEAGVTTIAGGKSNVAGYRDGPSEDAKFSSDFDVVYVGHTCSLLVVDRGNAALRQISLQEEDCEYQYDSISATGIRRWLLHHGVSQQTAIVGRPYLQLLFADLQKQCIIDAPSTVLSRASAFAIEARSGWPLATPKPPISAPSNWESPLAGFIKINCDGAFVHQGSTGGAAAVGRDSVGQVVDFRVKVSACSSPIMAEAKAICLGILLASESQWKNIIIESDSLSLILALNSSGGSFPLEVLILMEDMKASLCGFERVSFSFIPRSLNGLAHWLATLSLSQSRMGIGFVHPSIQEVRLHSLCDVSGSFPPLVSVLSNVDVMMVIGAVLVGYVSCMLQQGFGPVFSRTQQTSEDEFQDQMSSEKPTLVGENIIEDPDAGWPSFGRLLIDLAKLTVEALGSIFLYFIPLSLRPGRGKKGLTPIKDSLMMPEEKAKPPLVQKQRTTTPLSDTRHAHTSDGYAQMKPQRSKSVSMKDPSLSSKHRSSKRQEFAEFYGSGEAPPYSQSGSKSQKERTRHRHRERNAEVVFGAVGTEPKPVEIKSVDYSDPKFDHYNIRSKYGSNDSSLF
ncbi:hypothetical protein HHK36_001697 [Tetracentron sinense]|uniref:RNase H type-1 domain-containing protein n=1 Tax=Tetracentron sinense TaxID=13715 RepID=A0A834ZTU9_TETSI|nr:hypothetical protein HHK36_001697 [Tetracentron sinense]